MAVRPRRPHRAGRCAARQHRWWSHRRELHAGLGAARGGGTAGPRRGRSPSGQGLRGRAVRLPLAHRVQPHLPEGQVSVVAPVVPEVTASNRPFFEGAREGELRVQRCSACGHHHFPPTSRCAACLSVKVEWTAVSGRGSLWSWVVMHRAYFTALKGSLPYEVGFVRLDEGPMMMTRLVEIRGRDLACDMPVEVVFERVTADLTLPMFRPLTIGDAP
ncbi:MAG: hypothetical protein GEV10_18785 [Streptosporangiales bacterium]|nr:hypothetical protein [Streptosporangiales bacterium]